MAGIVTKLDRLISRLEPELRAAFLAAIEDLRGGIDDAALVAALERGDVEAAIAALNIDAGAFNEYVMVRTSAFAQAGALTSSSIDGISFRFDMTNPRAEAKIRAEAAARVKGYTDEQVETARRVIADGYAAGQGPQNIAVDVAGRINRATGRREGGIVGLSDPQAGYTENMRRRLLSGDPDEMAKVLKGQTLRDKRYDRTILKAMRDGKPLTREQVDKMVALYTDRLIKRRAEDIARTETAQGVMMARAESYAQALDKAGLPLEALTKTWRHNGGLKDARVMHVLLNGVSVQGLYAPFLMADGVQMQYSHDPEGGAKHNVGCRCSTDFFIDFGWGV